MRVGKRLEDITEKVLDGVALSRDEKRFLFEIPDDYILNLISAAHEVKLKYRGKKVSTCSIVSARTGLCSEDCAFCAQSSKSRAKIERHQLLPEDKILEAALKAEEAGAERFSIVTSGRGMGMRDVTRIAECIETIRRETRLLVDVSLGILGEEEIEILKDAGVSRIHHNIETSPSFFPKIVTTHSFREREKTVRRIKLSGLEACSGFILGMGESVDDRIEIADILNVLDVDSVPVNFLIPIEGTKMEGMELMRPLEALKCLAAFRFMMPDREIRLCGGRVQVLRDLQALAAFVVDGILIGHRALTTSIRDPELDLKMLSDLGFA